MEFCIKKFRVLLSKRSKFVSTHAIDLPDGQVMKEINDIGIRIIMIIMRK